MTTTRNRWLPVAGAAAACVAVIAAGTVAANAAAGRGAPAAAPAPSARAGKPPAPSAPAPIDEPPVRAPLGEVVDTGLRAGDARYVLYAVPVDLKELPRTTFGVMLGRRLPDGTLTADVTSNEVEGPDRAPGFHAVQGPTAEGMPTFGYYAGPAARITARAGGRTVTAQRAVWSDDPRVVLFWFPPADRPLTGLTAYDRAGRELPAGNNGVGVG
jgi:hypothetical protein